MNASDPTSAYLGPKLWNNPISLEDLMDEDSGSGGEAVAMADIFYDLMDEDSGSGGEAVATA